MIASGGLDSAVLAYWLAARGAELTLLSFDYGQRHRIGLDHAADIANVLDCPHEILELSAVGRLLVGSALTDTEVLIPDGYYTDESMRATVLPNRNAITLDIAVAVAVARKADAVAFGAHGGRSCHPPGLSASYGLPTSTSRRCRNGRASRRSSTGTPRRHLSRPPAHRAGRDSHSHRARLRPHAFADQPGPAPSGLTSRDDLHWTVDERVRDDNGKSNRRSAKCLAICPQQTLLCRVELR